MSFEKISFGFLWKSMFWLPEIFSSFQLFLDAKKGQDSIKKYSAPNKIACGTQVQYLI
jgi:hypothetical protein